MKNFTKISLGILTSVDGIVLSLTLGQPPKVMAIACGLRTALARVHPALAGLSARLRRWFGRTGARLQLTCAADDLDRERPRHKLL